MVVLSERTRRVLTAVVVVSLPLLLLHRAIFFGEALVPADLLAYIAPWSHTHHPSAAWNVLRYDGITQFYPWRLLAARALRSGQIPLWNPYTFAAAGGAPLLADSQSAPLYPLNWFFALAPPGVFAYIFGFVAVFQMVVAGSGLYRFLRALPVRRTPALIGVASFVLSGPIVTWLSLPTFLSVACWIPWLLFAIRTAHVDAATWKRRRATGLSSILIGLMLLGGHLQIALYGLLIAALYATWCAVPAIRTGRLRPTAWFGVFAGCFGIGLLLALPQVLPAFELSRISHRAGDSDYTGYLVTALPVRNLVTALLPDFFGHPNPIGTPYWNTNNYAEWALYAGVAPLLLAFFAVGLPWNSADCRALGVPGERAFFAVIALLALLVALGTPLNALLFYGLPGFRQTGNPGRILILFNLSVSVLAAIGADAAWRGDLPRATKERATLMGIAAPLLLAAFGAGQAAHFQAAILPGTALADLIAPVGANLLVGAALVVVVAGVLLLQARVKGEGAITLVGLLVLTIGDLLYWGVGYNSTSPTSDIYPVTPGIAYLQSHALPTDTIAPINRAWSIPKEHGPYNAVLPPNALTVYGLHDLSGYDSLFPGVDKIQVRVASGPEGSGIEDPSPPENGNMVFIKRPETALALGARFLIYAPEAAPPDVALPGGLHRVYADDDLVVMENPNARPFVASVGRAYQPTSFRLGLFTALCALGGIVACEIACRMSRDRNRL